MKKILLILIFVGVGIAQTQPILLPNDWLGGTVTPSGCSSGISSTFYNWATKQVFDCTGNVYTSRSNAFTPIGPYDMRNFGGICDGVTDNYSILTSMIAAGMTNIRLPAGCKIVAPAVNYNLPNGINIVGEGNTSLITVPTPSAGQFLSIGQNSQWTNLGVQDAFCYQNAYPANTNKTCYVGQIVNSDLTTAFHLVNAFNYNPFLANIGNVNNLDTVGANAIAVQEYGDGGGIYGQYNGGSGHNAGSGIDAAMAFSGTTGQALTVRQLADGTGATFWDQVIGGSTRPLATFTGGGTKTGDYLTMFHTGTGTTFSGRGIYMNFGAGTETYLGKFFETAINGTSKFYVSNSGSVNIGNPGTTTGLVNMLNAAGDSVITMQGNGASVYSIKAQSVGNGNNFQFGPTGNLFSMTNAGMATFPQSVGTVANTFASLPTCVAGLEGQMRAVTDSNTNVWGASVASGGANHVLAYCNGTAWTVAAK